MSDFGHNDNVSTNGNFSAGLGLSDTMGFASGVEAADASARSLLGAARDLLDFAVNIYSAYTALKDGYNAMNEIYGGPGATPAMDESGLAGGIGYGLDGGYNGPGMGVSDSNGPGMGVSAGMGGLY